MNIIVLLSLALCSSVIMLLSGHSCKTTNCNQSESTHLIGINSVLISILCHFLYFELMTIYSLFTQCEHMCIKTILNNTLI